MFFCKNILYVLLLIHWFRLWCHCVLRHRHWIPGWYYASSSMCRQWQVPFHQWWSDLDQLPTFPWEFFRMRKMTQSSQIHETFTILSTDLWTQLDGLPWCFFVGISLFRSNFAWWKMFSKRRGGWAIKCGFLCIETGQALVSSLLDTRRQRLPTVNQTGTNETRIQQSNKGKKTSRSTWVSIPLILVHAIAWFRNSLKRLISDSSYSETGLSACVCLGVHV